jgi:hypothetical protein
MAKAGWASMRVLKFNGLLIVATLILSQSAVAETSKEYALLGKKVVSAFMCSATARAVEKTESAERLFKLGHESAKVFLEAANSGKINSEDIRSTVPMIVTMRMRGPSIDFIAGTFWEGTVANLYEKFGRDCEDCILDDELKAMWMGDQYRSMNCELLK